MFLLKTRKNCSDNRWTLFSTINFTWKFPQDMRYRSSLEAC